MSKIDLDKYYTPIETAKYCIDKTNEIIGVDNITEYLEPSAGNGAFSNHFKDYNLPYKAFDIAPECDYIKKQDFLKLFISYKKGRCIIGNPPFGDRNKLVVQFYKKSIKICDYIAFILPISQLNNNQSIYKYDLIYSEDLGRRQYSDRKVHCCFNIYSKPINIRFNKKINYKDTKIIEIREIREVIINKNPKRNRELGNFKYDFAICAWGASVGKICNKGDFAKTFYIKIKDLNNFKTIKELILNAKWKSLYPMTATPNLLQWQVYKYLKEQIPELE